MPLELGKFFKETFQINQKDKEESKLPSTENIEKENYKKASIGFYQKDKKGNYSIPNKMNLSQVDAIAYGANLLYSQNVSKIVVDKYIATMLREQEQTMGVDSGTLDKNEELVKNEHGVGHKRFVETVEKNYGVNPKKVNKEVATSKLDKTTNEELSYIEVTPPNRELNKGAGVTGFAVMNKIGASNRDPNPYDPTISPNQYLSNAKLSSTMFSDLISDDGTSVNIQKWNPGFKNFDKAILETEQDILSTQNKELRDYLSQKLNYDSKYKKSE
jgi:hypothetical protein